MYWFRCIFLFVLAFWLGFGWDIVLSAFIELGWYSMILVIPLSFVLGGIYFFMWVLDDGWADSLEERKGGDDE